MINIEYKVNPNVDNKEDNSIRDKVREVKDITIGIIKYVIKAINDADLSMYM